MKKNVFFFIVSAAPVLPVLSLFSFGILFVLEFSLLFLVLTGARKITRDCGLSSALVLPVEITVLLVAAAFFSGFLRLVLPVPSVLLEFHVFAAAFSYLLFDRILHRAGNGGHSSDEYPPVLAGFVFLSAYSLLREVLYFGTISVPIFNGVVFLPVLPEQALVFTRFWGSFSGSLILTGLVIWLLNFLGVRSASPHPSV